MFSLCSNACISYEEIELHPETVSNIKSFINKCNWDATKYASKIDDWKMFEKINLTIALKCFLH